MNPLKMYFLLKMVIFHCYVSLPEGRCLISENNKVETFISWPLADWGALYHCGSSCCACSKLGRYNCKPAIIICCYCVLHQLVEWAHNQKRKPTSDDGLKKEELDLDPQHLVVSLTNNKFRKKIITQFSFHPFLVMIWSNYSGLTRNFTPHGGLLREMGPLNFREISRLVKYYNLI